MNDSATLQPPEVLEGTERVTLSELGLVVACDTETTGLCVDLGDRPFAIGFCDEDGKTWSCSWPVDPFTREVKPNPDDVRALRFFFRNPDRRYVFHHGKFDVRMLASVGVIVPEHSWDDTLVAAKCLKTDEFGYGLKPLAKRYLKIANDDEDDLKSAVKAARREAKKKGWKIAKDVEADYWLCPELCDFYMLGDVVRTVLLWGMYEELLDDEAVRPTYDREMRLQPTVCRMEDAGAMIDRDELPVASKATDVRLTAAYAEVERLIRPGFNCNSPKQKQQFFYGVEDPHTGIRKALSDGLCLPIIHRTKKKDPSTDREALEDMNRDEAEAILAWTKQDKMRQFYEAWRRLMDELGVLHPSLEPQSARTGRFGCKLPNLQQVPKHSEEAKEARRCFIPRPGYVWWALDYSQMELRLLAGLAGEASMLAAYAAGRDIHAETAKLVFGALYDTDPDLYRSRAKAINFGIIYGMGAATLARTLGTSLEEAQAFLSNYHAAFPAVREFMEKMVRTATEDGCIVNPFGRQVNVKVKPWDDKSYTATNYMIQSTGADMIKRAMPYVEAYLVSLGIDARMILQVHDELIIEVAIADAHPAVARGVRDILEDDGGYLTMDLPVDFAIVDPGSSWAEKKELQRTYLAAA